MILLLPLREFLFKIVISYQRLPHAITLSAVTHLILLNAVTLPCLTVLSLYLVA